MALFKVGQVRGWSLRTVAHMLTVAAAGTCFVFAAYSWFTEEEIQKRIDSGALDMSYATSVIWLLLGFFVALHYALWRALHHNKRGGVVLHAALVVHRRRVEREVRQEFAREREAWEFEKMQWKVQKTGELYLQVKESADRGLLCPKCQSTSHDW